MPLFEFRCTKCSQTFEFLTRQGEKPLCPKCGSEKANKLFSTFAVSGGEKSGGSALPLDPCGSCGDPRGPGSCRFK